MQEYFDAEQAAMKKQEQEDKERHKRLRSNKMNLKDKEDVSLMKKQFKS